MCQRIENQIETAPVGKLIANELPEKPWIHLTVDFITKLPLVVGKNTILIFCGRLSKMTDFVAKTEVIA